MMQQRRDEILAKKAKLAELKRQRELRTREISSSRQSIGSSSDVNIFSLQTRPGTYTN
jgi:dynein intermediate chain